MFKRVNISAIVSSFVIVSCVLLTNGCDDQSEPIEQEVTSDMGNSLSAGDQSGGESDIEAGEGGQSNTPYDS